jgi:hypothetical protein
VGAPFTRPLIGANKPLKQEQRLEVDPYQEEKAMSVKRKRELSIPEIGLIAATRGMIGFGVGLLLADKFEKEQRRTLGWSLLLAGAASTIPIALHVFGENKRVEG